MAMKRRDFLKSIVAGAGAAAGSTLLPSEPRALGAPTDPTSDVFRHGVASGDPTADGVVIWTRVTPTGEVLPGSGIGPDTDVRWQVAKDPSFRRVVESGIISARQRSDHTVKVDVTGLDPATTYYYRFKTGRELSGVGRTRTPAAPSDLQRNLRFGLASCANWEGGFFSAYRFLAEREDLEFILHMGDYLYEYGPGTYGPGGIDRVHEPDREIVSLSDYRIRHAQYKTDPDLQACHSMHPFIAAWDDHEVTNDTWKQGAENHQEDEGDFIARRNRAYRAYFEWMPIRLPRPRKDPTRIYRRGRFGQLADLHMLDTRQYRDQQPADQADQARHDAGRTITGEAQMEWLKSGLSADRAAWRLIGNQLMITPWETGEQLPFNVDAWDGYTADRQKLLGHIQGNEIPNVVFLTGDIHTSWANEVPIDDNTYPLSSPVAVEMVGPSITSDNADEITGSPARTTSLLLEQEVKADNPWVKYVELDSHGYSVVDVTKERLNVDWFFISDRTDPDATEQFAASFKTEAGTSMVTAGDGPV